MQNSILLNDAMQAKPAGIHVNVNEGNEIQQVCNQPRSQAPLGYQERDLQLPLRGERELWHGCMTVVGW